MDHSVGLYIQRVDSLDLNQEQESYQDKERYGKKVVVFARDVGVVLLHEFGMLVDRKYAAECLVGDILGTV